MLQIKLSSGNKLVNLTDCRSLVFKRVVLIQGLTCAKLHGIRLRRGVMFKF